MTAQVSERLIYGDKEIPLFTNPLSLYMKYSDIRFVSPHTANWRGYVGTWQILEHEGVERLYLVALSAHKTYEEILSLSDVFPDHDKVFAHWYTGQLRCPQGAQLEYRHMGYGSIYEYDLLMDFKQGVLVGKHARHNEVPKPKDEKDYSSFLRRGK
ncbi:hypothetical protein [Polynucleobacter sp. MWH-UH2A]|uniref:hypothetical protein n=1 Tax=Polynucleobacter sp. MWH-UH2A TaxID=1855617 RepID=UPI001BFD2F0F|nr:hypothetical protein [Polynucleobacter sp. MWH-UH2A]QWD63373.1 hypothetical protein IC571_06640 [Polynucleobacter sp. MWH-UH2A]